MRILHVFGFCTFALLSNPRLYYVFLRMLVYLLYVLRFVSFLFVFLWSLLSWGFRGVGGWGILQTCLALPASSSHNGLEPRARALVVAKAVAKKRPSKYGRCEIHNLAMRPHISEMWLRQMAPL